MTNPEITRATPLQDALYELALAMPSPDAGILDEFVRRYPDYTEALTDLAVELALESLADKAGAASDHQPPSAALNASVSNAMSRFHNRLYAVQQEETAQRATQAQAAVNPFAAFDRDGIRALGLSLNANNVFMMKLRDRQIDAATMTAGFTRRVAEALPASLDVVLAHFAAPAQVGVGLQFKAEQKPEAGQKQSFEDAVRNSGLTEEQQRYLLSL